MKRNILIVMTYAAGYLILNVFAGIYLAFNLDVLNDSDLFDQFNTYLTSGFYITVTLALLIFFRKYLFSQVKDFFGRIKYLALVAVIGVFTIYAMSIVTGVILQILQVSDQSENQDSINSMFDGATPVEIILLIAFVAIFAPIVEELVFRKGIYGIAGKLTQIFSFKIRPDANQKTVHLIASVVAIIISSLLFGLMHLTPGEGAYLIVYGGLGAVLGTVYYFSNKNIITSMIVHSIYNSVGLLVMLFLY